MGVSRILPRPLAVAAVSLGLALAAIGGVSPARAVAPTSDPAGVAAGWLATKVEAGGLPAGSLADAIFAFAAARTGATPTAHALTQLGAVANGYIGYGGTLKPGALGKVMLAVIVAGGDPTSFNGHDLETDLRGLQITSGADAGLFTGATINDQALDILALAATSGGVPAGAGDWLAAKQCAAGDYSWDGSCPVAAGSEDPDTTAAALQALLAAGNTTASGKATAWLLAYQAHDGSLSAYGSANANSTGSGGEALRAAGQTTAADQAAAFVASLQYGCSAAAADRGAIPYTTTDPGYGGPFSSTAQGVLAFSAPRLDKLRIEGAAATAPNLTCAASTPTTKSSAAGSALPTQPPTDSISVTPSSQSASSGLLLVVVALVVASGALAFAGRREHRR